jgi:N-acetylglucosaminyldiphosphoundecaprenol N-acetyl-beta-D-mannosaminyltransferase
MTLKRCEIMGTRVDLFTLGELTDQVAALIKAGKKTIVASHNLHSLYLWHREDIMRQFYSKASITYIDGMSLVVLGRLLREPTARKHRITLLDWLLPLLKRAGDEGWRVMFLGSREGVGERAALKLKEKLPNLTIKTLHGYFDQGAASKENISVLKTMEDYGPQLLLVGMGMPRQERWIVENLDALPSCVVINAGAIMDYVAGEIPTPPRWVGRVGFEWLYRLFCEPRRLWKRYLVEPFFLLRVFGGEILKRRQ